MSYNKLPAQSYHGSKDMIVDLALSLWSALYLLPLVIAALCFVAAGVLYAIAYVWDKYDS